MTEKSLLINDQADGEVLAMRDAYELDENSEARIIPRICYANIHFPSPLGAADRTASAIDSMDLDACPAELKDNLIECGDKSRLVLFAEFTDSGSNRVRVSLVYYDSDKTPLAHGFRFNLSASSTSRPYRGAAGQDVLSEPYFIDTLQGASWLGLHITELTTTGTVSVRGFVY